MMAIWSDKIFEDIIETMREAVLVLDSDLKILFANQSFYDSFKVMLEETVGSFIYDLGNRQWDIPKLRDLLEEILPKDNKFNNYEVEHEFMNIGHKVMLLNARRLIEEESDSHKILLAIEDITERNKLEFLLKDSEERFRRLFETANDGILLLEKSELKIHHANPAITGLLGYSSEDLVGSHLKNVGFPEDIDTPQEILQTLNKDGIYYYCDALLKNKDGQEVDADIYMVNKASLVQCNIRDITGKKLADKRLEIIRAQLQQSLRMEAISTLTGGIAHDYNNLMSIVMGNLSLAIEEAEPGSFLADFLDEANTASHKVRNLTHELMSLSRGGAPVKELGSLDELLKTALDMMPADRGISLNESVSQDLWHVLHDPYKMGAVFRNVVTNAVEAMPEGGTLNITAENLRIDDKGQYPGLPLNPGNYVHISFQDQGVGIPEEQLDKIFDPYFSTKEMGVQKGMGLGLATAYAIVKSHGGHVAVDSTVGVGTTVNIYLPAQSQSLGADVAISMKDNSASPTKRVLFMDDEEMLRNLARQMLEREGYAVATVKDGVEAIEAFKKQKASEEPFDAVILDLMIKGGMGGEQTIRELLKIDPDVKAIVSSGYFNDPVMADFEKYGFKGSLAKPYEKGALKEVLEKLSE